MSLPKLPSIRELIKIYGLSAKSQLSQNFILDKNITDKIIRTTYISEKTPLVVEVGPGPGLLSRSILDSGAKCIVAQLSEASDNRFQVINGNILTVDHKDILSKTSFQQDNNHPVHIIGNLPFNIASPLLLQWLHQRASQEALFSINNDVWLTLMFQKEVGDRIIADASTSKRGRLSVMTQSLYNVKEVYKVPSTVFVPRPKVDASVIQFSPKPFFALDTEMQEIYLILENLVRHYFTKRRKTIGHITKHLGKQVPEFQKITEQLETIVDFQARPEDVSTETFCNIAKLLYTNKIKLS
ncbi:S-adenosyl-L-methionine-dependent methyltransferase [Rhizopus microsporus var. microsporus]|uniref:rRNA adenine N(6)-methyltransferase n=1 Tax=Rhizopus microsporus var. microsporus TaxID=86635 RepID=A0A1X0R4R1_RHIZD|nr:S-adenosyl-L-methionine-dependent methyltransferase [Rhizopus microsporus var. microsporus]